MLCPKGGKAEALGPVISDNVFCLCPSTICVHTGQVSVSKAHMPPHCPALGMAEKNHCETFRDHVGNIALSAF